MMQNSRLQEPYQTVNYLSIQTLPEKILFGRLTQNPCASKKILP